MTTFRSKVTNFSGSDFLVRLNRSLRRHGDSPDVRMPRALEHFSKMHQMLASSQGKAGVAEGLRGFEIAGVAVSRDLRSWLQAAAGQSSASRDQVELEVPVDVRACSGPSTMAVVRGLCFLGAFQAAARIRRSGRQKYLEMDAHLGSRDWLTVLVAQSEVGNSALVQGALHQLAERCPVRRTARSVALAAGIRDGAFFDGQKAQTKTSELVRGVPAVIEGPLTGAEIVPTRTSQVRVRFKYLGRCLEKPDVESCDISIINRHAFSELVVRFGEGGGRHVMSPCQLVLFKNRSAPPVKLDAICERLGARPALLCDKASLGLMAIEEILLAGASRVHVTGMDLWTGSVTADRSYPFYDRQNRRSLDGGLTSISVARSAGIHEPISQLHYLQRLRDGGLLTVDDRLARVLNLSDLEYAAILEREHGYPFIRQSGWGQATRSTR